MPAAKSAKPTKSTKDAKGEIYAVVGSDESEVKRVAKELSEKLSPGGDFGCDIIDGVAENADHAAHCIHQAKDSLLTIPFFGGEKLVWLKNANFFADTPAGRSETVAEAFEILAEMLAAGLPDGIRFLLSAPEIDKRRTAYKTLGKIANVQIFDKLTSGFNWEEDAKALVRMRAQDYGLSFNPESMELFIMLTGGDTRQIQNELDKLDLYLGHNRRHISLDDVREIVPLSRAGVIFEIGNAIANRDLRRCLALLDQLMQQGETAIGILLATIVPTVRNLILVKDLMERHRLRRPEQPHYFTGTLNKLPESATEHLPRKKDGGINSYALGIAARSAHLYQLRELRAALEDCLQTNVKLVSTSLDPKIVISELLIRIVAPAK